MPDLWRYPAVTIKVIRVSPIALRDLITMAGDSEDGRETGGVLLGFDATGGSPITVSVAGDPGPLAERSPLRFRRDLAHAQELAREAWLLDGSMWIGDWHTHPLGYPIPSGTDLQSYRRVLASGAMPCFLSIIVSPHRVTHEWREPDIRAWVISETHVDPVVLDTGRPRVLGVE